MSNILDILRRSDLSLDALGRHYGQLCQLLRGRAERPMQKHRFGALRRVSHAALEPFADGGRTHGKRQEADIWFSMRRYRERQQWVGKLNFTPRVRSPSISDRSRPVRWTRLDPEQTYRSQISRPRSGQPQARRVVGILPSEGAEGGASAQAQYYFSTLKIRFRASLQCLAIRTRGSASGASARAATRLASRTGRRCRSFHGPCER